MPDPATAPALKTFFNGKFKVGFTADPAWINDAPSQAILIKHAGSITAENVMKAQTIGTSAGVYNYGPADQVVNFAQANNIAVRGHALVWHSSTPAWFFAGDRSDMTAFRAIVRQRLETYITDVVTHFKGKIYAWDVVNEPTSDDAGSTYRNSEWYQIFCDSYLDIAFRAARAADPDVELFINDYSTEDPGKRARYMTVIQTLLDRGVPIDGVGHQFHISTTYPSAAQVEQALIEVEAKGLINHVTELDISFYTDPGSCFANQTGCVTGLVAGSAAVTTTLRTQALQYRAMYNIFASRASVESVTTWGVADNHTWLSTFPVTRLNLPLLFDTAGNPKSAFWAVVDPAFVP
ncbi:beta-xylanase [Asticcacaulis endophyticus]|uniref:Beta-xylanase n=1 Tax=Asticcacaulis endophyticus TaxID=1395890 RepID=A0A918Q2S2_9CAUL|nr:beta-xylanase [Asticcacaulis endophyticus]